MSVNSFDINFVDLNLFSNCQQEKNVGVCVCYSSDLFWVSAQQVCQLRALLPQALRVRILIPQIQILPRLSSEKSNSFKLSKTRSTQLSKWIVSDIDEKVVKSAREFYKPKLNKKHGDLFKNPTLDESFYLRLKKLKNSTATKANFDASEKTSRNLTYKILDLVKPLLFLSNRATRYSKKDARAVRYALKLWVTLFNDVIKSRRRNIMTQMYPGYTSLLDDKRHLLGGEFQFGPKFVSGLINQYKTLAALNDDLGAAAANQHTSRRSADDYPSSSKQSSSSHNDIITKGTTTLIADEESQRPTSVGD